MKLEFAPFPVTHVRFGDTIGYKKGILEINREELVALVSKDSRIRSVDVDVAFPGEETRIVNCRDAVEPRTKVSGPGCVFPGILGPVETVGEGRTHSLSGVAVMTSAEYRGTISSGTSAQSSSILDMSGPGAEITPFSSLIIVVLILRLMEGVSEWDAHAAIQSAGFKVGCRLAETTRSLLPAIIDVFDLAEVDPSLPRVVYILSCCTIAEAPHSGLAYYGLPLRESLPIVMHPNELIDGALTSDARRGNGGFFATYSLMNQPVALELLRSHGKRLNFLGLILERTEFPTEIGKQAVAKATSQIARLLGAQDVIITRLTPSGNSFIEVMLTVQACVRKGIKTVLMVPEWGGSEGTDLPLLLYLPEATAMVSTGSFEREIKLLAPAKVIGSGTDELVQLYPGDPPFSPWGEVTRDQRRDIFGGIDWFGGMNYTCREY